MKAFSTFLTILFITLFSFNFYAQDSTLVTFQVDMSEVTDPFTTPEWNSEINGWCGSCTPMADPDNNNIWEVSVMLPVGEEVEYKFSADNWTIQESLTPGSSCTITTSGFTNRKHTALAVDEVLDVVCWESCNDCGVVTPTYDLAVTADVSLYSGAQDISVLGMYIGGSFNGWTPSASPMTDNGNGTWSATLTLDQGSHEWKYVIGSNWEDQENLIAGSSCTVTDPTGGFTNRFIDLQQNETLSTVCLDYCVDCANIPEMRDITFSVDMTNETPLSGGVFVFGSFNNWVNNQYMLEDLDGDNVFETTIQISDGSWEYKYTVEDPGVGFNDETLDMTEDAACTIATDDGAGGFFVNRSLTVSANEVLSTVCFASCDACVDPTACVAENFVNPATGLTVDQTVNNGTKTQLLWDHYSDATMACIIRGALSDGTAPTGPFGQVVVQGPGVAGDANGNDKANSLAPDGTYTLFNPNTYPVGTAKNMVPGAQYMWTVQCGCIIDLSIPPPARYALSNVHLSPLSANNFFTNLSLPPVSPSENTNSNEFEDGMEKMINIYPNPNNGIFVVDIYNFDEGLTTITVRDLLGEVISSSTITNTSINFKAPIDLTAYPAGYYSIEITDGAKTVSKLVMKK